jgi:hypothetical protein
MGVHNPWAPGFLLQLPQTRAAPAYRVRPAVKEISDRLDFDAMASQLGYQLRIASPVFIGIGADANHHIVFPTAGLFNRHVGHAAASAKPQLRYHVH